jgi:hypothetical protein
MIFKSLATRPDLPFQTAARSRDLSVKQEPPSNLTGPNAGLFFARPLFLFRDDLLRVPYPTLGQSERVVVRHDASASVREVHCLAVSPWKCARLLKALNLNHRQIVEAALICAEAIGRAEPHTEIAMKDQAERFPTVVASDGFNMRQTSALALLRGHWGWKDVRGINLMSKHDEYRDSAARVFELAARASSSNDKSHLLDLAEKWLDLADRSRPQATPPLTEHPLVKRAFQRLP